MIRGVESVQNFPTHPCRVNVASAPEFIRGDCNFDEKIDLADAQAVIQHQFGPFTAPCEDACDANDDGKINLADAVLLLNYLFNMGDPPEDPFPDPGQDETEDTLTCDAGESTCP